jgi:uncharacterized glyoxalase superfamily protein PhnB
VFCFERHLVVPDDAGGIAHAQLVLSGGMIMLGSARDDDYGHLMKLPEDVGGAQTQSTYLVVPDADAVHERVVAAGASVAMAIKDEAHGGRGFGCFDPEAHFWYIGSYDPWA